MRSTSHLGRPLLDFSCSLPLCSCFRPLAGYLALQAFRIHCETNQREPKQKLSYWNQQTSMCNNQRFHWQISVGFPLWVIHANASCKQTVTNAQVSDCNHNCQYHTEKNEFPSLRTEPNIPSQKPEIQLIQLSVWKPSFSYSKQLGFGFIKITFLRKTILWHSKNK